MTTLNPYTITKTGWIGDPVLWSGQILDAPPIYDTDGVTLLTPGVPHDISLWWFMLTVKKLFTDLDPAALFLMDWQIGAGAGTLGNWSQEWPAANTSTLDPIVLRWDIKVIKSDATEPGMFMAGSLVIQKTVGRRYLPEI